MEQIIQQRLAADTNTIDQLPRGFRYGILLQMRKRCRMEEFNLPEATLKASSYDQAAPCSWRLSVDGGEVVAIHAPFSIAAVPTLTFYRSTTDSAAKRLLRLRRGKVFPRRLGANPPSVLSPCLPKSEFCTADAQV